ncbi:NUDIX hydrolase [Nocardioides sp. LHD-245]|uniref:NUDIX hydrolase n=1 Tax=Nocardioides sp. LHD-245 TaxID=3051387 RepID=UPI0027DF7F35|nr:NUDIX hydrolase [Nocardioides sp. LHD-245]
MDPLAAVPQALVDEVRRFADERRVPVDPRDASSVILLRDGSDGPEVYLLRRHAAMAFAGGFCVFPGGGVDPRDFDAEVGWAGPSVAAWAAALRCEEEVARALVCAAIRETFEESGVLFAGPTPDSVVSDTTGEDWEADRRALEARELSLTDLLARRGLVLRSDLLRFWAHWITPDWEPRRFDTRFFVAVLPAGQSTRDVSTESEDVTWLSAAGAVAAVERQELAMLPPTYINTGDVAAHPTTADVMAAAGSRLPQVVRPELVVEPDGSARLHVAR